MLNRDKKTLDKKVLRSDKKFLEHDKKLSDKKELCLDKKALHAGKKLSINQQDENCQIDAPALSVFKS